MTRVVFSHLFLTHRHTSFLFRVIVKRKARGMGPVCPGLRVPLQGTLGTPMATTDVFEERYRVD